MLDYSETLENTYLAFNPHIGLKNKKIENLVAFSAAKVCDGVISVWR